MNVFKIVEHIAMGEPEKETVKRKHWILDFQITNAEQLKLLKNHYNKTPGHA